LHKDMKLLINSKSLSRPLTGIGRYTYEVVTRISDSAQMQLYYDFYGKMSTTLPGDESSHLFSILKRIVTSNKTLKLLARQLVSRYGSSDNHDCDVYWEPCIVPESRLMSKKNIVTVHDMSLHLFPHWHMSENVEYFKKNFWDNIKKTDVVITDTETVKAEVSETVGIHPDRIKAIHLGVDHEIFKSIDNDDNKRESIFKHDRNFIVFVGSIEPRKNIERLIKAYKLLPKKIKDEYCLLLTGYKGWGNKAIHSLIESEKNNIKYLGYVPDKELAKIYRQACCFVYPSLYEGFGLPPLEAMACGIPVIVSKIPCLKEVCGKAAHFVDPFDTESIRDGILHVLSDKKYADDLALKGSVHSAKFNWNDTAKQHLEIFKNV